MFRIIIPSKRVMSYGDNDVMFILETLERNLRSGKRAGRADVADSTCIGEGIVRTILTRLDNMGFLDITKRGITLSGTGIDFLDTLGISLMDMERTDSAIGGYQVALLIKGKAELIQKGIEQRNSALKAGGAETLEALEAHGFKAYEAVTARLKESSEITKRMFKSLSLQALQAIRDMLFHRSED